MTPLPELLKQFSTKRVTRESLDRTVYRRAQGEAYGNTRYNLVSRLFCSSEQTTLLRQYGAVHVLQVSLPDNFLSASTVGEDELAEALHGVYALCDRFPDANFFVSTSYGPLWVNLNVFVIKPQTEGSVPPNE